MEINAFKVYFQSIYFQDIIQGFLAHGIVLMVHFVHRGDKAQSKVGDFSSVDNRSWVRNGQVAC